jgi:hypothetical protein
LASRRRREGSEELAPRVAGAGSALARRPSSAILEGSPRAFFRATSARSDSSLLTTTGNVSPCAPIPRSGCRQPPAPQQGSEGSYGRRSNGVQPSGAVRLPPRHRRGRGFDGHRSGPGQGFAVRAGRERGDRRTRRYCHSRRPKSGATFDEMSSLLGKPASTSVRDRRDVAGSFFEFPCSWHERATPSLRVTSGFFTRGWCHSKLRLGASLPGSRPGAQANPSISPFCCLADS